MSSKSPSSGRFPAIIQWILQLLPWALVVAELVCVGVYAARASAPRKISPTAPAVLASASSTPSSEAETPSGAFTASELPEGRLFVTAARGAYQDGAMQLFVPKLGTEGLPVSSTSGDNALESGVGLSEFSQLPAEKLGNVIILGWGGFAAPPDGDAESEPASSEAASSSAASALVPFTPRSGKFKGLETLSAGDSAALTYDGARYTYAYKDTNIFEDDDWAPLYVQGFNCLSLVSPVGNGQSVVVRFELTGTEKL